MEKITAREKWMVLEGFVAGYTAAQRGETQGDIRDAGRRWLKEKVSRRETVESILVEEASRFDHDSCG